MTLFRPSPEKRTRKFAAYGTISTRRRAMVVGNPLLLPNPRKKAAWPRCSKTLYGAWGSHWGGGGLVLLQHEAGGGAGLGWALRTWAGRTWLARHVLGGSWQGGECRATAAFRLG